MTVIRSPLHTLPEWLWTATAAALAGMLALLPLEWAALCLFLLGIGVAIAIAPAAALALMLIVAPLRTLIATEAPGALPVDIGQLALALTLGAWGAASIARARSFRLVWTPLYLPLLIFIAITGLSAFSAWSLTAWLSEWLKWIQIGLLIAVCLSLSRDWRGLVFALTAAGAINAVVGIYQYFGGSGALHLLIDGVHFRAFGTFGQPNPFGGFMGLLAPVALMAALGCAVRFTRRPRIESGVLVLFYASAGGLMAAALFMSYSRGAWLAFVASAAAMVFALPRKTWVGFALVGAGAIAGAVLLLSGRVPASIVDRINSITQETLSISDVRGVDVTPENYANIERLAHWQAAVNMATAYPLLGVGFGNYEVAYPAFRLLYWEFPLGHAHNYYLNVLGEAGMMGLLAYIAAWSGVILLIWRARRHPDPFARCVVIGVLGTWVYLAVHSMTDNLYVNNVFLHLGVVLGLVAVLHRQTGMPVRWQMRQA